MPRDVRRPTGYRAAINLYVEDGITKAYLEELWIGTSVAILLGGGNEGVDAIARVEQHSGYSNVFGLIDRDFRPTNRDVWLDPQKTFPVFILPRHEIENYLLDADALRASRYQNLKLSRDQIESHLVTAASRLCWWVACREVLAELKRQFRERFIPDPSQSIIDEGSARRHICESEWFLNLAANSARFTEEEIHGLLGEAHKLAVDQIGNGRWRIDFAGKEIFKDVSSRICNQPRVPNFPPGRSEFLEDLAKEVAAWQVANGSVPPDLTELLTALKDRIRR